MWRSKGTQTAWMTEVTVAGTLAETVRLHTPKGLCEYTTVPSDSPRASWLGTTAAVV